MLVPIAHGKKIKKEIKSNIDLSANCEIEKNPNKSLMHEDDIYPIIEKKTTNDREEFIINGYKGIISKRRVTLSELAKDSSARIQITDGAGSPASVKSR